MIKKILLTATALMTLGSAHAAPESLELNLTDIRLPVSASGMITFRACDNCPFQQALATADASWVLNGSPTTFDGLRDGAANATRRERSSVTLTYDKDANRITRIKVTVR